MTAPTITPIRITTEGRSWQATLEDLVCEDEETREAEEAIRAAFARGESYRLGGGAAPLFVLTLDRREALDAEARAFMDRRPDLAPMSLDEWLLQNIDRLSEAERKEGGALLRRFSEYGGDDA